MSWETTEKEKKEKRTINFVDASEAQKKRGLKILVFGKPGSGKTHFALSFPDPIFVIDTEMGSSIVASNFSDKKIKILDLFASDEKEGYETIEDTIDELPKLIKEHGIKTIVLDSTTDFWECAQGYAKLEIWKIKITDRLKQQWDWGTINKLYYRVLKKLLLLPVNVILTCRAGEVYAAAGQPTGSFTPRAQKDTGHWVDMVIESRSERKPNSNKFFGIIDKCRTKGDLQGKVIENISYESLQEMLK